MTVVYYLVQNTTVVESVMDLNACRMHAFQRLSCATSVRRLSILNDIQSSHSEDRHPGMRRKVMAMARFRRRSDATRASTENLIAC